MRNYLLSLLALFVSSLSLQAQSVNVLHFDGVDDYVYVGGSSAYAFADGTVEIWVKRDALAGEVSPATSGEPWEKHWSILMNDWGIGLETTSGTGWLPYTYEAGKWYHLAYVFTNGYPTRIYVNGEYIGELAIALFEWLGGPVYIGQNGEYSKFFNGALSDLRMWRGVSRTEEEIRDNMNNFITDMPFPLVGNWTMNEGFAEDNNQHINSLHDQSWQSMWSMMDGFAMMGRTSNFVDRDQLPPPPPTPLPRITAFSPLSGKAGTELTITGSDFNGTAANNVVHFGTVKAEILSGSATSITVKIPKGATAQPITVTDIEAGVTGISTLSFTPIFDGDQSLPFPAAPNLVAGEDLTTIASRNSILADLNGDGLPELLFASGEHYFSYQLNKSQGNGAILDPGKQVLLIAGGYSCEQLVAADFDGDGKIDILALAKPENPMDWWRVMVYRNTSTATSISFEIPTYHYEVGMNLTGFITVGDVNTDGKPDIITIPNNPGGNTLNIIPNSTGGNNISFGTRYSQYVEWNTTPVSVQVVDLNNDQKQDLLIINRLEGSTQGSYVALRNTTTSSSNPSFSTDESQAFGTYPSVVAVGDYNIDGTNDLMVVLQDGTLSYVLNFSSTGDILGFSRMDEWFQLAGEPKSIAMSDMNGDGKPDFSISYTNVPFVTTFYSGELRGQWPNFTPQDHLTDNGLTGSLASADIDGDGRPDLLATRADGTGYVIMRNINGQPVGLPVSLVAFTAERKDKKIQLSWRTAMEINSDYFDVERSADGVHFSSIGRVAAQGNSGSMVEYSSIDQTPLAGENFYRLTMVDKDGSFKRSNVIRLQAGRQSPEVTIQVSPVPFRDQLTVRISNYTGNSLFVLFDHAGRKVQTANGSNAINTFSIKPGTPAGIYYYTVLSAKGEVLGKGKLIKQ
ncbi:MAG: FG-GAP-like repeat-containing protein [Candidatus Pseudobacter hemicellulosilyticus]|uniref:FG-GAP-like repeat-containing protein n=1 Tax=Candidatus Pseudobacter hemicellulosilyticus TaxID=3121375 RepID=A0AAJ5WP51_9BACT|nr:MAG: FG-GAP-like repeat-containing protein [Pseudobacter sp.]